MIRIKSSDEKRPHDPDILRTMRLRLEFEEIARREFGWNELNLAKHGGDFGNYIQPNASWAWMGFLKGRRST